MDPTADPSFISAVMACMRGSTNRAPSVHSDVRDMEMLPTVREVDEHDTFQQVFADAELYSLSCTEPSSRTFSTAVGPGATAGHGMMVMGEWLLHNLSLFAIQAQLRSALSIATRRPYDLGDAHVELFLEYQR